MTRKATSTAEGAGVQRGSRRVQLTVAEIAREHIARWRRANELAESDADERACQSQRRAFADQRELQLAARHAERAQQTQRSAPAQHRQ